MKIVALLILTIVLGTACSSQKNTTFETVSMEYSAHSRGMFQNVLIEKNRFWVTFSRNEKPVEKQLSAAQWKLIASEFEKLNLKEIPNLKAPTQKRLYDGAAIANLKITAVGNTYETQGFDHGYPPAAIEKIVTLLVAYTEK